MDAIFLAMGKRFFMPMVALFAICGMTACSHDISQEELMRAEAIIGVQVKPGMNVGEIGAGAGRMSVAVAKQVGPSGHVYSTEIDPQRLARIRRRVERANLDNVSVIEASATKTNLPGECCDLIFMTGVYHHFTNPAETDASIYNSLRPGGVLAIQDFRPAWWLAPWTPKDVPANRGGHGIPENVLIDEVTGAGFHETHFTAPCSSSLFLNYYCVVFTKPGSPTPSAAR